MKVFPSSAENFEMQMELSKTICELSQQLTLQ